MNRILTLSQLSGENAIKFHKLTGGCERITQHWCFENSDVFSWYQIASDALTDKGLSHYLNMTYLLDCNYYSQTARLAFDPNAPKYDALLVPCEPRRQQALADISSELNEMRADAFARAYNDPEEIKRAQPVVVKIPFWRSWFFYGPLILTLLLAMLSGCAALPNTWTKENQHLEIAYQAVHLVDLGQTLDIKRHPGLKEGHNWFLGEHPSDGKIAVWYAGTAWGHAFVTSALENENAPRWMCRTWQVLTIGDAVNMTYHNYQLGVKVKF